MSSNKPIAKSIIPIWLIFVGLLLLPEPDRSQCEALTKFDKALEVSILTKIYCRHGRKIHLY